MNINDEKAEIVRTIVMLANNLGIEAIAEGLETVEQMVLRETAMQICRLLLSL